MGHETTIKGTAGRGTFITVPLTGLILSVCLFLSLLRGTKIGPFYPSDEQMLANIDYGYHTILNIILLAGLGAYVFFQNDYRFLKKASSNILVAIIGAAIVLSLFVSMNKVDSIKYLFATSVISFPTILYISKYGSERFLQFLADFVIFMAIVNLLYLVAFPQYGIMSGIHSGSWRGMFEHKNGAGPFFVLAIFILINQMKLVMTPRFFLQVIALTISFIFMVMSHSSTALVAFACLALLYPLLYVVFRLSRPTERLMVFLLASSLALLVFFLFGTALETAFFEAIGKDATLTGRTNIWAPLFDMSFQRPILGYGFGMSQQPEFISLIHGSISFDAKSTHNSYLDLILSIGYPATVVFVGLVLSTLMKTVLRPLKSSSDIKFYALAGSILIVMLLVGVSSTGVFISRNMFWLFTLMSLLILSRSSPPKTVRRSVSAL